MHEGPLLHARPPSPSHAPDGGRREGGITDLLCTRHLTCSLHCSSLLSERGLLSYLPHLANREAAFETLSDFPNIRRGKAGARARSRAQVFLLPSKWPSAERGHMVIRAPHLWLRTPSDLGPAAPSPSYVGH